MQTCPKGKGSSPFCAGAKTSATGAQSGVPGTPGSLLRQRDVAAAFPFAGSTSSKAEHVSQTHTHTEDTEMAHYTDCHRQGVAFNSTYI